MEHICTLLIAFLAVLLAIIKKVQFAAYVTQIVTLAMVQLFSALPAPLEPIYQISHAFQLVPIFTMRIVLRTYVNLAHKTVQLVSMTSTARHV